MFTVGFILLNKKEYIMNAEINKIEKYLEGTESNFSRFVIQACEYVLNELEEESQKLSSRQ